MSAEMLEKQLAKNLDQPNTKYSGECFWQLTGYLPEATHTGKIFVFAHFKDVVFKISNSTFCHFETTRKERKVDQSYSNPNM